MKYLNKVQIIGNLTRDPDAKESNGSTLSVFSVATNREWTDAQGNKKSLVEYHNVAAWGKLADFCNQNFCTGKLVYVEGYLKTRSWESDGQKQFRTEIVAEEVSILSAKEQPDAGETDDDGTFDGDPAAELE